MGSKKILVVEDNPDSREIMALVLRHRGYAVVEAEDAETALEIVGDERPDLVLMDISLPRMDGFEATDAIRRLEGARGGRLPIVALTAKAMVGDREKCIEAGASDYIAKPVDTDRLLSLLCTWLGRRGGPGR